MTAYAHNEKLLVKKGQTVSKGQKIATMGNTGSAQSPQLHFETRYKTKVVNPKNHLP
ncbi:MAG: M23 family metallopeptidase [Lactobacillales bacterium]|nr:M23 family metallopeptidase [Lactobacillales bacterium]